jgi:predicted nucleotidyltransferase
MASFDSILSIASTKLSAAGVDCVLIGGLAVNYYGYSRNTLDVDFMILSNHLDIVRDVMIDAGFPNIEIMNNVAFFRSNEGGPRVDFLLVNTETIQKLLAGAEKVKVHGHDVKIPAIRDLLATKIFALSQNTAKRMGKDLPDIAYLTVLNDLDLESDIHPLCDRFGDQRTYELIREQVKGLQEP